MRYVIAVNNCGTQYEIRKRWQELYTMSTSISKLDEYLPESSRWRARGGKSLGKKRTRATKPNELDGRVNEITDFCAHLSGWLTQLAKSSNGEINILNASANPDKNLLADFFAQGASYESIIRGVGQPAINTPGVLQPLENLSVSEIELLGEKLGYRPHAASPSASALAALSSASILCLRAATRLEA